jgi:tripartite-type tricarboxylate transporter receptor subunit TctC
MPARAAGDYPSRPVKIVVTYTTGGAADIGARVLAERLTEQWGEQVLVENRPGGGGNIGIEAVRSAPADGYTLLMISNAHAVNMGLFEHPPFDLVHDFAGITYVVSSPMVIASNPKLPARTLPELIALIRANPGRYSYASCGNGTSLHLAMEMLKAQTGSFVVHVPYRGCSPATLDTVAGQTDMAALTLAPALPHIRSGRLTAIALINAARTPAAPDIPTVREVGGPALADYAVEAWYGLAAPAGTPQKIIEKIGTDARAVLNRPEVRRRLADAGVDAATSSAEALTEALRTDIARFKRVIDQAHIRSD